MNKLLSIVKPNVTAKQIYNGVQNAKHVKDFLGKEFNVTAVYQKVYTKRTGEQVVATFFCDNDDQWYMSTSISFTSNFNEVATLFSDDILGSGLKMSFEQVQTKDGKTIYNFKTL